MRGAVLEPVQGLTVAQLDHLHDAKANSIGALLLHLAAIERLYQIHTFEGKKWETWTVKLKSNGVRRRAWARKRAKASRDTSSPITSTS